MKFTKPINREVEIDGQNFVVSFDDISIEFRLKGKRKTVRVEWAQVLDIARSEDGEDARALLGLGASTSAQSNRQEPARMAQNEDAMARTINPPAPAPQSQPDGSAQSPPSTAVSSPDESSDDTPRPDGETSDRGDEQGRAVTASDIGPES
jgi:stringent starvation protein B